jgi:hypothetical protein
MAKILTDAFVRSVHELHNQQVSGRAIADQLGCSEATVRRALRLPVPSVDRRAPQARQPILLSRRMNPPAPCPPDAPAYARRLYPALVQRGLLSELDALIVFADLEVERTHLCLNVFDVDALLCRLEILPESVDLTARIARLRDAFYWDEQLRRWCRDMAREAGV